MGQGPQESLQASPLDSWKHLTFLSFQRLAGSCTQCGLVSNSLCDKHGRIRYGWGHKLGAMDPQHRRLLNSLSQKEGAGTESATEGHGWLSQAVGSDHLGLWFSTHGLQPLWRPNESITGSPKTIGKQILTLSLITVAKLQRWGSSKIIVWLGSPHELY